MPMCNIMPIMCSAADSGGFLYDQAHTFHTSAMFVTTCYYVNSCGINAAVAENVGKFSDVFFNAVKGAGEQVAQIVRKYF